MKKNKHTKQDFIDATNLEYKQNPVDAAFGDAIDIATTFSGVGGLAKAGIKGGVKYTKELKKVVEDYFKTKKKPKKEEK